MSPSKTTSDKDLHQENAPNPIFFTPAGITILVKPEQKKALCLICFKLVWAGNVIRFKEYSAKKHLLSMISTDFGIDTWD
jgi:hypothetical protein